MDAVRINPFNELYVTETIPPEDFVQLFSPFLIKHSLALFQPGNIVLKGVQGSGKSMLLNLLKPEIRIAYKKQGKSLPNIPTKLSKFIGAGINLTRSVAIDFGQRAIEQDGSADLHILPLYFADFFNYWVVQDILNSLTKLMTECDGEIAREIGISEDKDKFRKFARELSSDPCWFGHLKQVDDYPALLKALTERIAIYRSFLNFNIRSVPTDIQTTKTTIGEPISKTVRWLRQTGIVARTVPFFVRIDQYEELYELEEWTSRLGLKFRQVVNKALGVRDPNVSYRIGSRRYAWEVDLAIYGTRSVLERERDYKIVDIDLILRRGENRRTWIFPDFAEDVFARRAQYAEYPKSKKSLGRVLGNGLGPEEKARRYASTAPTKMVEAAPEWPTNLPNFLLQLATENPLSGKLAEAWITQHKGRISRDQLSKSPPWERLWWRKERIQQALMHIAWQYRQRMTWAGREEVLALSGGNILVFVSICQHIWASWIQSIEGRDNLESQSRSLPSIDPSVQAAGIHLASSHWYNKIPEKTFQSHRRQRFIDHLGILFRNHLISDKGMSYPGHNGFSVKVDELESSYDVYEFLRHAVDYGDLFDAPHTTKTKDRKKRIKWYLNPILSPYFQIPVTHVKEPLYVSVEEVHKWLLEADRIRALDSKPGPKSKAFNESQLHLFSNSTKNEKP